MRKIICSLAFLAFTIQPALSATWKEKCSNMKSCIDAVSELTGEQYVYQSEVEKGTISFTNNLAFEKEDADLIFTNILFQNGLSRVAMKPNVYEILRANDAKSKDLPRVTCDQRHEPALPNTYDLVIMEYKFTNPGMAKDSENVIRTYADMGARIYGVEANGTLIIVDVAKNLSKIYHLLVSLDIKPTPEYLAKQKAREAAHLKAMENNPEPRDHRGPPPHPEAPKK